MRGGLALMAIALQAWTGSALAQPREFQCVKAFSEMAPEYPRLVCAGNDLLERGNPKRALEKYNKAAEVSFFESPNFLIYYRIARAQSAIGDRAGAIQTLSQFADMLAIYGGEKACTAPGVDPKAVAVMCSEAFGPDGYGAESGLQLRKQVVGAYRQRVVSLKRSYRLVVP